MLGLVLPMGATRVEVTVKRVRKAMKRAAC
jgi:hypothetical protein